MTQIVIPQHQWKWFGDAGHFCAASACRFHLCTKIGKYLVSTIGEYYPDGKQMHQVGLNRLYETMVFDAGEPCACGCGRPKHKGDCLDSANYDKPGDANAGHIAMCMKYACLNDNVEA